MSRTDARLVDMLAHVILPIFGACRLPLHSQDLERLQDSSFLPGVGADCQTYPLGGVGPGPACPPLPPGGKGGSVLWQLSGEEREKRQFWLWRDG